MQDKRLVLPTGESPEGPGQPAGTRLYGERGQSRTAIHRPFFKLWRSAKPPDAGSAHGSGGGCRSV